MQKRRVLLGKEALLQVVSFLSLHSQPPSRRKQEEVEAECKGQSFHDGRSMNGENALSTILCTDAHFLLLFAVESAYGYESYRIGSGEIDAPWRTCRSFRRAVHRDGCRTVARGEPRQRRADGSDSGID